jgi:hypothetical protein
VTATCTSLRYQLFSQPSLTPAVCLVLQVVLAVLECICLVLQAAPRVFESSLDKLMPQLFLKLSDNKETVTTLAFRALTGQHMPSGCCRCITARTSLMVFD